MLWIAKTHLDLFNFSPDSLIFVTTFIVTTFIVFYWFIVFCKNPSPDYNVILIVFGSFQPFTYFRDVGLKDFAGTKYAVGETFETKSSEGCCKS